MDKFEVRREWHYTIVENHVLKANLSPYAKLVYVILCMYSNKEKECYPSLKTLCKDTGLKSKNTIQKALKELEEIGLLDIQTRYDEKGALTSNLYIIKDYPISLNDIAISKDDIPLYYNMTYPISPDDHKLKPYNYNQKELNSSCSSNSTDMGEIYKYYEQAGFGVINQKSAEYLNSFVEIYSKEWVIKAIDISVKEGKYKLSYVEGILQNWKRNGGIQENKPKAEVKSSKKVVNHPYINYSGQRQYDVSELEKKLLGKGELSNE